jgi:hypothetical protein
MNFMWNLDSGMGAAFLLIGECRTFGAANRA